MSERLADLSTAALEEQLLEAANLPGRRAMARVTAIRTVLARRPRERDEAEEAARAAKALELVNAHRGPGRQLTEIHETWVGSILEEPEWAALYPSDEELRHA